ncbi:putative metal-dependent peptidase [Lewinella aquimaris]|uniref:Putative metal-dependent peptidase n=1 Tax=Neolewinella aquimaris TaxID=1835722 RepID=A0A840EB07_9BACT|nr:VWA-like domain-containing protein [Neolewinella aquimaris]MBB4078176.1 putative metal-dependent peptidase [Neolewinella aquimaris]
MSSPNFKEIAERVRFARAYAAEQLPWFAPALFRSNIVITPQVEVASIDLHYNVYWNPVTVDQIWRDRDRRLALSELGFLWIHEISHRLRRHGERATALGISSGPRARRWNIACDFEINDSEWSGLKMPAAYPGMLPEGFGLPRGQLAETYLLQLEAGDYPDLSFAIDEGSGIHGLPRPWEAGDRQRLSTIEEEIIRREVARRSWEASQDLVPDAWRDWAADVLGSRVNWRQRLGHRLSVALQRGIGSRTDYSYARPSRRQSVYQPIMPPSLAGDQTARIAIVVDTSASMQATELQRALSEVAAVVRQFNHPVTIIPCDLVAYEPVREVSEREAFRISYLPGGSGTDMRAGIDAAVRLRPRPDSILVLTDGMTVYPQANYPVPVIFGILRQEGQETQLPPDPPFGPDRVVMI